MFDFLTPNSSDFEQAVQQISSSRIGHEVTFFDEEITIKDFDFVLICANESRGNADYQMDIDFETIKYQFYNLQKGNWSISILDMGILNSGSEISDTYYALKSLVNTILKEKAIPIILGGSQDLLYQQYRGYDGFKYMVNLTNIDFKFDLGDSDTKLCNESFLSHMIVDKPYNLFNYANIGYQNFFNSQEEISLLDKMFFESYRLGDVVNNMTLVEPVLRDADLVGIDIRSVESRSFFQDNLFPNGFNSREICALTRYSGLSDRVTSIGIYELQYLSSKLSKSLVAQMLWYFVEGTQFRIQESPNIENTNLIRYQVPVDDEVLIFYESQLSGRWWVEIPSNLDKLNNKLKQHSLLPCDKENYLSACNQELPERWIKARQKNEI